MSSYDNHMLSETEELVLVSLWINGANTPSNISNIIDRHTNSVSEALKRLVELELCYKKGRGVYAPTYRGFELSRAIIREDDWDRSLDDFVAL